MAITRTSWIDDDGTGTTGTVINNAEKTLLYDQIDAALAGEAAAPAKTPIPFPAVQVPSSNPNTLDDYEEGTMTLVGNGITLAASSGRYVKIGKWMFFTCQVTFPVTSDTGRVQLSGLPYVPGVASGAMVTLTDSGRIDQWFISAGGNNIEAITNLNGLLGNNVYSGKIVALSGHYEAAA